MLQSMMKLGEVSSNKEAVNFLLGRVGRPHIDRYVAHVSSSPNARTAHHAIVRNIQAHNYPTGRQTVGHSGATTLTPAILEVKTYTRLKLTLRPSQHDAPCQQTCADSQAGVCQQVPLDTVFAVDVVGDKPGAIEGPFTCAQQCFHTKQIIPLCAGWFGEVNKGMVIVLKELTRLVAAGNLGLFISLLENTDKKGGAYPIMWQQVK